MVQLINDDCLKAMQTIPDKSIDMILCDLPYGTTSQNAWDKRIDEKALFSQYDRIVKMGGVIALFSQLPFTCDLVNAYRKYFRYEIIWDKSQPVGFLNANKMPLRRHENILIFYKKLPTYNPQKTKGKPYFARQHSPTDNYGKQILVEANNPTGDRYPVDILKFPKETGLHPTQKPVKLLEWLVKTYTNEGETVLDNCMGSGSTGVACVNTNRNFIGIELDKHYYEIASKRINEIKAP